MDTFTEFSWKLLSRKEQEFIVPHKTTIPLHQLHCVLENYGVDSSEEHNSAKTTPREAETYEKIFHPRNYVSMKTYIL